MSASPVHAHASLHLHVDYLHASVIHIPRLSSSYVQVQGDDNEHTTRFFKAVGRKARFGIGSTGRRADARVLKGLAQVCFSIDLSLVAWAVLDTLRLELLFDVFGNTALYGDRVHPTHVLI